MTLMTIFPIGFISARSSPEGAASPLPAIRRRLTRTTGNLPVALSWG